MNSTELRRLADEKMLRSNAVARDADRIRVQATALHGLLDPVVSISQGVWVGPAATDFEQQCAMRARQVDNQARELQGFAGELDQKARRLREEAARLRSQAHAADVAAANLPTGVA
jgi:hypothetical protein